MILRPGAAWWVEVALGCMIPVSFDNEWKLIFFVFMKVSLRLEDMLLDDCNVVCVPSLRSRGVLL